MARRAGIYEASSEVGEEGSVKAAIDAAERSEHSGEPLQVPTASAKKPSEAGAL